MSQPPPPYGATDPSQEKSPYPPSNPPPGQYPPPPQQGGYPPPPTGQQPAGNYPPPPAGGYQQPPPVYTSGAQTTVITTQPAMVAGVMRFGEFPMQITCPHCQAQVVTSCTYTDGTAVWLIALLICLFGGWLGCCLIPFCVQGLKDVTHSCPNCTRFVGSYRRM